MNTHFFRMIAVAGAIFAMSQSVTVETAQAGSALDLGAFLSKHSGKIDSLVDKYGLESVRDKYLKNNDKKDEPRTGTRNSSRDDDKWDFDNVLSNSTLKKFR